MAITIKAFLMALRRASLLILDKHYLIEMPSFVAVKKQQSCGANYE